jgi:hypothetical protein
MANSGTANIISGKINTAASVAASSRCRRDARARLDSITMAKPTSELFLMLPLMNRRAAPCLGILSRVGAVQC